MLKSPVPRVVYILFAIVFAIIVARAWSNVKGTDALQPSLPQSTVQAFARQQLDALQPASFAGNQELCGIIYETSEGTLGVTRQSEGDVATCDISFFDEPGMVPVASFHTHGSHSPQYDGEVPSLIDIQSDVASGIDGYVATPGGRFWHIDHDSGAARLVCGPGCLAQDPAYVPCADDRIAEIYTAETLAARFTAPRFPC
ncbi:DUF4329 domain-containing protein [Erythrobacter sp.]|jgi:hypothetical protein|uniref:DUF4329 domain-containing protein n=1 Tax=Erythrobacter sp. TaxID=1042 RepID=UPI002EAB19F2|nr:DUF4329 domain-containing protein [Erythrobacter sp.]